MSKYDAYGQSMEDFGRDDEGDYVGIARNGPTLRTCAKGGFA